MTIVICADDWLFISALRVINVGEAREKEDRVEIFKLIRVGKRFSRKANKRNILLRATAALTY
jgi:hypothetical protein